MARFCTFRWCDDLDGRDAVETVEFAIDRRRYSIDLSSENAARLRAVLAEYLAAARVVGPPVGNRAATISATSRAPGTPRLPAPTAVAAPSPQKQVPAATATTPESTSASSSAVVVDRWQVKAMRQWARRHGYEVPSKGRLPDRVVAAYHQQAGSRRINIRTA